MVIYTDRNDRMIWNTNMDKKYHHMKFEIREGPFQACSPCSKCNERASGHYQNNEY